MLWPTLGGDVSRGSDSEQLGHSGTVSEALYFIAAAPAGLPRQCDWLDGRPPALGQKRAEAVGAALSRCPISRIQVEVGQAAGNFPVKSTVRGSISKSCLSDQHSHNLRAYGARYLERNAARFPFSPGQMAESDARPFAPRPAADSHPGLARKDTSARALQMEPGRFRRFAPLGA
jgi:hypothetical protein